jgi:hypothetical protein
MVITKPQVRGGGAKWGKNTPEARRHPFPQHEMNSPGQECRKRCKRRGRRRRFRLAGASERRRSNRQRHGRAGAEAPRRRGAAGAGRAAQRGANLTAQRGAKWRVAGRNCLATRHAGEGHGYTDQEKPLPFRGRAFDYLLGGSLRTVRKRKLPEVRLDRFLSGTDVRRGTFAAATHTVNRRRRSLRRRSGFPGG